jgi:hypothetical protein
MSLHRFTLSMRGSGVLSNVFALLLIAGLPVRADSVTYSFFGSAWLQDTSFTYVSPNGFLTFDTGPLTADSEGWRSAFRTDVDHDSEVMPISNPN